MRLFRLSHSFKAIEMNVIKETAKTVVYSYPNEINAYTIRKIELDKKRNNLLSVVATSLESLLSISEAIHQENVSHHKRMIELQDKYIRLIRENIGNGKE